MSIKILESQLKKHQQTQQSYLRIARNDEKLNDKIRTLQKQITELKSASA
jgi:hypothetical protein